MPHIKVKPFDIININKHLTHSSIMKFIAKSLTRDEYIISIEYESEEFFLQLIPQLDSYLLKYDKVTRPLKVNIVKKALALVAQELELTILFSNITISSTKPPISSKYFKKIEDFEDIEYSHKKVSIEVGFGSGKHILYQASKNKDTLFIGLEIHTPSAQQVLKQIELQELTNVWVVNYDARLFLEMIPSNLCEKIFVHFPVPWDKKPHRRVISKDFLAESMRVLRPEGKLELRTDSDNYFWYSLETFFSVPKTEVEIRKNESLDITSKYEARWLRQEKDIYDVYVTSKEDSLPRDIEISFDFLNVKLTKGIESKLSKKPSVYDGYFVHFERVYKSDDKILIIKCAFGSFDRPEHKYIILDEYGCRYYSSQPVKTLVNLNAHNKIIDQLS